MDPLVEGTCGPHMLFIEPWALHAMNLWPTPYHLFVYLRLFVLLLTKTKGNMLPTKHYM
jgi:hypothetical protein